MHLQGEQLRGILQLQVFHPLPGLLTGVLCVHRSHRAAVFHQILDGESHRALRHAANSPGDADLFAHGSTDEHPVEWVVHGSDLSPCFLSPFPSSSPPSFCPSVIPCSCTLGLCSLNSAYRYRQHHSRHSGRGPPFTFSFCVYNCFDLLISPNLTFVKCLPAKSEWLPPLPACSL